VSIWLRTLCSTGFVSSCNSGQTLVAFLSSRPVESVVDWPLNFCLVLVRGVLILFGVFFVYEFVWPSEPRFAERCYGLNPLRACRPFFCISHVWALDEADHLAVSPFLEVLPGKSDFRNSSLIPRFSRVRPPIVASPLLRASMAWLGPFPSPGVQT